MTSEKASNPFKPGNGHMPPHLAGRTVERAEFQRLLAQDVILQNLIITGLRGIGKTVLLESFKPLAQAKKWLWAGTDCSESVSVSEDAIALRILTDVALLTSNIKIGENIQLSIGFRLQTETADIYLNFEFLTEFYRNCPGFVADKLKATLLLVWQCLQGMDIKGVVFAYDEAQTLSDHAEDKQYPLSLLLDVFSYLQKNGVPFMLVLTGLPTLITLLVNTRTYTERLFRVLILDKLTEEESRDAITVPISNMEHPLRFNQGSIDLITKESGGYPYFIQFICREVFDIFEQQVSNNEAPSVPVDAIIQKLDNDFFAGRWAKATDREKELLTLAAQHCGEEFSVRELVTLAQEAEIKPFSGSQISQMLNRLIDAGLIYRNRRASYSFAVPLLERYITRTMQHIDKREPSDGKGGAQDEKV
jgi:hypothetical protein